MDEENRQVIERLAEAVDSHNVTLEQLIEAVNGPDWWVIGITIVNAAIMAWLGWRQYLLQRQQTKQNGYELYRQMYAIIRDIDFFAKVLLNRLYEYFSMPIHRKMYKNYLEHLQTQITKFDVQLAEKSIDFKIWLPNNKKEVEYYKSLVYSMRLFVQFLIHMEMDREILYIDNYDNRAGINASNGDYVLLIDSIVERTPSDEYKRALKENILQFIQERKYICQMHFLEKIERFCKYV